MSKAQSIDPSSGQLIEEYPRLNDLEIDKRINSADKAFEDWSLLGHAERARYMNSLATHFKENVDDYGRLISKEMGKVFGQARAEIEKCAWICDYYAENTASMLKEESIDTEALKSYVRFEPIGVVLAVMPWNFPFYQVVRFIAPALMAGNAALLKHASNVQGCAFALENAIHEVGFPEGLFSNLNIASGQVESVIANERVRAVTLTGSEPAGRSVATIAGQYLKKTVLELGGSDPYIILEDADLEKAVEQCVYGRLQNNGQTCIAAKRFIVLEEIYDSFLAEFTAAMSSAHMGGPMDKDSYYGPMARHDLRDELHEQVEKSIAQGAELKCGGVIPDVEGAYYPATVLADVRPGMIAFDEELFGPVASVVRAKDEEVAIELANASNYGLGSGVITKDVSRGERIAGRIESGNCFVNKLTASDPRMPFGGIKNSGYGRELSHYGIKEFTNIKSIWVAAESKS